MNDPLPAAIDLSASPDSSFGGLSLRKLGTPDYESTWQAMRDFTRERGPDTTDELWLLEHPPVFTLGQAGKTEHLLAPGDIPIINTDRGGQVTYHGPGQAVMYTLLDLKRSRLGIRKLVSLLETTVIQCLANYDIEAASRADAPGVYVNGAKIAALGLRVSRGCSYHGLALNVDVELEPFGRINPCGYANLEVTSLSALGVSDSPDTIGDYIAASFAALYQAAAQEALGRAGN